MNQVQKDIKVSLHEEKEASKDYARMAKTARKAGLKSTSNMFKHIKKEEKEHQKELKKAQKLVAKKVEKAAKKKK